jgi:hypothetical protein
MIASGSDYPLRVLRPRFSYPQKLRGCGLLAREGAGKASCGAPYSLSFREEVFSETQQLHGSFESAGVSLFLGDTELLAKILLIEHRDEGVLVYSHIDYDPIDARSSHRHLPFLASILPGCGRPAVSADPYKVSDFYYVAAHAYLLLNSNPR